MAGEKEMTDFLMNEYFATILNGDGTAKIVSVTSDEEKIHKLYHALQKVQKLVEFDEKIE